jgi:hypothetical protein
MDNTSSAQYYSCRSKIPEGAGGFRPLNEGKFTGLLARISHKERQRVCSAGLLPSRCAESTIK